VTEHLLPVLYALFVWWFSTGAILYLNGLPRETHRWSLLGATAILAAALHVIARTGGDTSVVAAYAAFTAAVLVWGWMEMSFFMGIVTGPRRHACETGCGGLRHFGHAAETGTYHEIAIVAAAIAIVAMTWQAPNQVAILTFAVLWAMRTSAKLNMHFGVRNLNADFLPEHIRYLAGFFRRRPMNAFFPLSVTGGTIAAAWLVARAADPAATPFEAVGATFVAALMVLAVIEHWLLVLPMPSMALWEWAKPEADAASPAAGPAPAPASATALPGAVILKLETPAAPRLRADLAPLPKAALATRASSSEGIMR
jgi:putative photosynthetic complex assembly protein 2